MKKYLYVLLLLAALALASAGCGAVTTPARPSPSGGLHWGVQTKTSGCIAHSGMPDAACTPGDILPTATKAAICKPGYTQGVRNVPASEKNQVYAEYGIKSHTPGQYEIDHFVPLELGGSNAIANLWPEAASPTPGFHQKDRVENYLHDQVCSGAISLKQAQIEIATNWRVVYNRMPNKQQHPDTNLTTVCKSCSSHLP